MATKKNKPLSKDNDGLSLIEYNKAGETLFQTFSEVSRLTQKVSATMVESAKKTSEITLKSMQTRHRHEERKKADALEEAKRNLQYASLDAKAKERAIKDIAKKQKALNDMQDAHAKSIEARQQKDAQRLIDIEVEAREKAQDILAQKDLNHYKSLDIVKKEQYFKEKKESLKKYQDELAENEAIALINSSSAEEQELIKQEYADKRLATEQEILETEKQGAKIQEAYTKKQLKSAMLDSKQRTAILKQQATQSKQKLADTIAQRDGELASAKDEYEKDMIRAQYAGDIKSQTQAAAGDELKAAMSEVANAIGDAMIADIDKYMSTFYEYQATVNARLQGSETTFQDITKTLKSNLGLSPYVQMKTVVENINKLADEGIAYNIEQRAFLASISDKIATTFDATNGTLMRLIRLQQADTTAARLGMEAFLTQFLNKMYEDTSYLKDSFDNVASALIDLGAVSDRNTGEDLEFTVQKWLGSLSSVGLSDSTVTKIAEGINYLGTGNVNALASNESLQTLLAMATSRAELPYGEILTEGLDVSDTNAILREIVEYLQEIYDTDNKVVQSEYANLFGVTMSDLVAISNLTSQDLDEISKTTLSYDQAISELNTQLGEVSSRMHIGEKLSNIYENAMTTVGTGIAENAATYILWKVNNFVEDATGGINIPFALAGGFGLDLNANVNQIAKLAIIGVSTVGQIGTIVSAIGKAGKLSLDSWEAEDFTSRGTGIEAVSGETPSKKTSESSYAGNSSGSDFEKTTLNEATKKAEETSEITNAAYEQAISVETLYKAMYEENKPVTVQFSKDTVDVNVRSMEDSVTKAIAKAIQSVVGSVSTSASASASTNTSGDSSSDTGYVSSSADALTEIKNLLSNGTLKISIADIDDRTLASVLQKLAMS